MKILKITNEQIAAQTKMIEEHYMQIQEDIQKQTEEFLSQGYAEDQIEIVKKMRNGEIVHLVQLKENAKPKSL
ncbi:hypothetical protein V3851_26095 [Paenibacillus sp. M1]|uniref:Uncharacterized protein n=1 Tax=Paenibacillus haidiansis TaxID=1574488 RepID=A0ABU7VZQ1_9BACL